MIHLANSIAIRIKAAAPDSPTSVEVMQYTLSFLLNAVFIIGLTLIISLVTGRTSEACSVLMAYAILRQLTGGVHIKHGSLCIIVSTAGATALSYSTFDHVVGVVLTVISIILILVFAPYLVTITRIQPRHHIMLRAVAIGIVIVGLLINSPPIIAAFFVQSLTLIHMKGGELT